MKIPCLDSGYVEYIDHFGNDLRIVNAARVSMGKHKDTIDEDDERLIKYLIKHKHTSPFRHCHISFRVKLPIFVMRQWQKHRIGVEINEISGRYVEFGYAFYHPSKFRKGSDKIKQGSLSDSVDNNTRAKSFYGEAIQDAYTWYKDLLSLGVCKEQARMVLPVSLYTEAYITMSLQSIQHFYGLRAKPDAQLEMQEYAFALNIITGILFPLSWSNLI